MRLIERTTRENIGQSKRWLRDKMETLRTRARSMILENRDQLVRWPEKGKMYLFLYLPENEKKLKYFDRAPLVIPTDRQRNRVNFRGLNLHYLHPRSRYELINRLLENGDSDLRVTRSLNTFLRFADGVDAGVILKTYLYESCKSRFLEIPREEWEYATALPIEHFKKEHKSVAWKDTRRALL